MTHLKLVGCCLVVLLPSAPALGIDAVGVVDLGTGVGFCSATYFMVDPCTGAFTWLHGNAFLIVDLDQFLCDYVSVSGPNIGVECVEIGIQTFALDTPACRVQVPGLRLSFNSSDRLTLRWNGMACVETFDVVRGSISELSSGDLGSVTCVAENVNNVQLTPANDPDPLPGETFFYLVRATGGEWGFDHYGHTHDGVQRHPGSGDCTH